MNCEMCHQRPATVHLKQAFNGSVREFNVCERCAREHGFRLDGPLNLTDFLFGVDKACRPSGGSREKVCPSCGLRKREFRQKSRLGCADCYGAFNEEIGTLLEGMQKGRRHTGRVPLRERHGEEIAALRAALQEAVSAQNFEEAARLRDGIRELNAASPDAGSGRRARPGSSARGGGEGETAE